MTEIENTTNFSYDLTEGAANQIVEQLNSKNEFGTCKTPHGRALLTQLRTLKENDND